MNQDHLGRNTLLTQTGEHLQGLVHPAAVVGVGVDKQGGSSDIADVLDVYKRQVGSILLFAWKNHKAKVKTTQK